jgi:hypothetical protein
VWLVVRGDFVAYREDVQSQFTAGNFPVSAQIPTEGLER